MTEKKLSIKQNLLYNSFGSMFYLVCQWLITVLVVQLSSYADAGNLSLAISITNIFFTIATFGIRTFQVSDINNKYSSSSYVTTRIITASISFTLCVGFVFLNQHYTAEQMGCIILYMVFRLSEIFVDVLHGIQQKAYRMDYIARSFVLRGVLLLSSFCLVLFFTQSLLLALTVMSLCTMAVVLFLDLPTSYRLSPFRVHIAKQDLKQILLECWPLMFNTTMITALVSIPRYFLEMFYDNQVLGFYSSVATPAVIVQTACSWIYSPLITTIAENYTKRKKKEYLTILIRAVSAIALCSVVILIGAALLGEWGLTLLFGTKILPYVYLLIPVLLTTVMIAFCYFTDMLLTITRRLKVTSLAVTCAVLAELALSVLLIQNFCMDGVNYVLYIGFGIVLTIQITFLSVIVHRHFAVSPKTNEDDKPPA